MPIKCFMEFINFYHNLLKLTAMLKLLALGLDVLEGASYLNRLQHFTICQPKNALTCNTSHQPNNHGSFKCWYCNKTFAKKLLAEPPCLSLHHAFQLEFFIPDCLNLSFLSVPGFWTKWKKMWFRNNSF